MIAHVHTLYSGELIYVVDYAADKTYCPFYKKYNVPFDEFKNKL